MYLQFYRRKSPTENFGWTFSQTSTEIFRCEFFKNLKVVLASVGKIIFKYVIRLSVPSVLQEKTLNGLLSAGYVYRYPAEEGVTEIFRCEFFENLKVVLASGGKIIFKYVIRLSLPSFLQEKTLNGEFPLDFFSNINGNFPSGNQIDSWLTVG